MNELNKYWVRKLRKLALEAYEDADRMTENDISIEILIDALATTKATLKVIADQLKNMA